MLVSAFSWHKNEIICLKGFRRFGNAEDTVRPSFVSPSAGHLGSVGNPPPLSLFCPPTSLPFSAEFATCTVAVMTEKL